MDRAIACPLCSQPGFSDVNSLWLTLIRATTRQLTCPICQEILCGLDKLTIHLVSHSLHDQMVQACLAQNLRPLPDPAAFRENQDPSNSNNASSKEPIQAHEQSEVHNVSAPYVSNNFPTLENNSQLTDFTGPKKLTLSSPTQGVEMSGLSSGKDPPQTGITFPSFLHSKSNDISSESNQPLVMPKNLTSQVTEPAKFGPFSLPMLKDVPQDKIGDKLFITDSTIKSNLNSHPQYVVQQRVHHLESSLETSPLCPPITKLDSIKVMEKCVSKFEGCMISCGMCDLSFKDNNIAMLHQQLVHNIPPNDDNHHQLSTQNDERGHYSKQWSKRSSTASALREAASPLHKYPCHICNKVFRMRGSLMVHLRVGHSPNASTLRHGSSSSHVQPADFTSKLPLQDLTIKEPTLSHPSSEDLLSSGQLNSKTNDHTHVSQIDATEGSRVAQEFALPSFGFSGSASSMCPKLSPTRSPPTASTENTGMIYPCGLCNKTYSKEAFLTQHLKSHDSKQWECDVCYKSFTTKYFLKKHKRLHTGEMPYTCGICNKSFTFQQSYHKHLLYHSDEKPHSCNECGRAFKELSTLHNHQRIHTGEKPWACETCGKCFRQRVSYLVHRRIHTGAMPYQCTVCLKSFRYKVSQRTHKCVAQAAGDAPTQSMDLLQKLLQAPSIEDNATSVQTSIVPGSYKEPSTFLKEHMKHLNIKQEHQNSNTANVHFPSGDSHPVLVSNETEKCFNGNFSENPSGAASKVVPLFSSKPISNSPLENLELQGNSVAFHSPAPVPGSKPPTPPPADFNIDLLQDFLSMVMSPSAQNAPSPSSQMRHLSLSANQNEDDLEAGLELRQLLYGSCDSDSAH